MLCLPVYLCHPLQLPAVAAGAGAVAPSQRAANGTTAAKRDFVTPPAAPVRSRLLLRAGPPHPAPHLQRTVHKTAASLIPVWLCQLLVAIGHVLSSCEGHRS